MGVIRFAPALVGLTATALLACGAAGVPAAHGQLLQAQNQMASAGKQLKAQADQARSESDLPALGNAGASLIRGAFDPAAARALPVDLDAYSAACGPVIEAYNAYNNAIIRLTAGAANPSAGYEALLAKLQNEATLGTETLNLCADRAFRAAVDLVTKMPADRRAGTAQALKQMRDGSVEEVEGTILVAMDPGLSATNRAKLLSTLQEAAPAIAPSLTAADRQKVGENIAATMAQASADTRAQLAAIARIFASSECNILCAVAQSQ